MRSFVSKMIIYMVRLLSMLFYADSNDEHHCEELSYYKGKEHLLVITASNTITSIERPC